MRLVKGAINPRPGCLNPQFDEDENFSNASSRLMVTVTLSSNAPGRFHVVTLTLCGGENENSPDSVGLPSIISLTFAIRFFSRL